MTARRSSGSCRRRPVSARRAAAGLARGWTGLTRPRLPPRSPPPAGSSQANKTDVSYGDDSPFTPEELLEVDRATMKCLKPVPMKKGDVVLLDNYRTMHGRGTFEGSRHNAVAWFSGIKN